jgi:hypothetical protein
MRSFDAGTVAVAMTIRRARVACAPSDDTCRNQMNEQAGGKWVRTPRSMGYFAPFCDLDELLDQVLAGDPTSAEKGEETDVEGQRAIALTADVSGGGTSTMWVASDAPHYLLKIETVGGDDPGVFTFSGYDEPVDVPIPPAEEVIDLGKVKAAK